MHRFPAYLNHLRTNGTPTEQIASAVSMYNDFVRWCEPNKTEGYLELRERIAGLFGRSRSLYITVADCKPLVFGYDEKTTFRDVMRELGFRSDSRYVKGVRTRIWLRGEWKHRPPRYGVKTNMKVPPCPVPPPPC